MVIATTCSDIAVVAGIVVVGVVATAGGGSGDVDGRGGERVAAGGLAVVVSRGGVDGAGDGGCQGTRGAVGDVADAGTGAAGAGIGDAPTGTRYCVMRGKGGGGGVNAVVCRAY